MSHLPPAFPAAQSIRTFVEGMEMHAMVVGEETGSGNDAIGPVYVLIHGLGMSHRYMMPTARCLAAHGKTVYVPDLPGFGDSGKPRHTLSIRELADALAGWMKAMIGIQQPVVLIGNSLGTQVIVEFAVRYPERVDQAVLIGPTIDSAARRFFPQMFRLMVDVLHEPLKLYQIGLTDYFRSGIPRFLGTLNYALKDRIEDKLPLIHMPVIVVRGGKDRLVPQRWVEQVVSLLPQGRLVVIPHAAHAVNFSAAKEIVGEVCSLEVFGFHGRGRSAG